MKTTSLLVVLFGLLHFGCSSISEDDVFTLPPKADKYPMPYFNEQNIRLSENQKNCLVLNWHTRAFRTASPVAFQVINDDSTYQAFFNCKEGVALHPVDFTKNTLLVGSNAAVPGYSEAPVCISSIDQILVRQAAGLTLRVVVSGIKSDTGGGEWFGFIAAIQKTDREVALEMVYQYE